MKTQMPKKDRDELLKRLAALVPFAKGSVCVSHKPCGNPWKCKKCLSGEMHPSVQYSFRENGKLRTMHVQPRFLKQVQEAVANGREVERLLVEAGKKPKKGRWRKKRRRKRSQTSSFRETGERSPNASDRKPSSAPAVSVKSERRVRRKTVSAER